MTPVNPLPVRASLADRARAAERLATYAHLWTSANPQLPCYPPAMTKGDREFLLHLIWLACLHWPELGTRLDQAGEQPYDPAVSRATLVARFRQHFGV